MPLDKKVRDVIDRHAWITKHASALAGVGITLSEATRRYGILQGSISLWAAHGHIRTLGASPSDSRAVLVDEAEIAWCAAARRAIGTAPGRKLFNPDHTLYIPPQFRIRK